MSVLPDWISQVRVMHDELRTYFTFIFSFRDLQEVLFLRFLFRFFCILFFLLLGGWTDTPPIAFECGGTVVNVAVTVDGERPIGARARRIKEPWLLLVSTSGGQGCRVTTETVCETLRDLEDHCQPQAPGEHALQHLQ